MNIETAIDEQIRLLQEMKRFAANPAALALMQQLAANGSSAATHGAAVPDRARTSGAKQAKERKAGFSLPTGLTAAVGKACDAFGAAKFCARDIELKAIEQGYVFQNAAPRIAVGSTLIKFTKNKRIEIVKRGTGSEPNIYRNAVPQQAGLSASWDAEARPALKNWSDA